MIQEPKPQSCGTCRFFEHESANGWGICTAPISDAIKKRFHEVMPMLKIVNAEVACSHGLNCACFVPVKEKE